jgi:hypothetical protein
MREFAGGTTGTIGHADKRGLVRFQFANGLIKRLESLSGFGRKKFKGQRGSLLAEDVRDVHLEKKAVYSRQG